MTVPRLAGRRVLVTRSAEDSREWAGSLAALGAVPVILPCIQAEALDEVETRVCLVTALRGADWLCVLSPRAAKAVSRLAGTLSPEIGVAAVGTATAEAALAALGRVTFVARGGTSRALGEELLQGASPAVHASTRIVVAGAEGGRTDAEEVLVRAGALVTRVCVYRTVPAAPNSRRLDLAAEGIGDVLLASPSAVQGLLNQASLPPSIRIFTIGPTTSAAVVAAGLSVRGEAASPDFDSLVEAMQ